MSERITAIAKEKLKEQERKKKIKGIVNKLVYSHEHAPPGSWGEKLSAAIQNRQTYKALIDSGMSKEDAQKRFEGDAEIQQMIREEYKRLRRIKKKDAKKLKKLKKSTK